jgi:hypothetical protein
MRSLDIYDEIGLLGVALGIFAYALIQHRRDYAKKLSYSLLNLASSIFVIVSLLDKWNVASFVSNFSWALISVCGIYSYMIERRAAVCAINPFDATPEQAQIGSLGSPVGGSRRPHLEEFDGLSLRGGLESVPDLLVEHRQAVEPLASVD